MDALEALLDRVESLRGMLEKVSKAGYANCPPMFKERLDTFASKTQVVVHEAQGLQSQQPLVRFINASDYMEKVEDWMKKLSWHVQSFILEGTITLELTVYEMAADVRQVSKQMGERFDQVDNGIAAVRSDISQLKTDDAIPGLRYASRARFDFGDSGRSACAPDTRKEVLEAIYSWLRPEDRDRTRLHELLPSLELLPDRSILWIYALAGAGKTTLAETVAKWCHDNDCLGSSFFCARDGDRSDVHCIVQNIASDLAHYCPEFREALLVAVKDNPHIRTASVSQQVQILLAGPVQAANAKGASWKRRIIVIDALDECKDSSAESTFLHALSLHIKELAPLIFVITSRPVPNITRGFRFLEELGKRTQELPLDGIPSEYTDRDIGIFLRARFADIGRRHAGAGPDWVSEKEVLRVVKLAERLFIFATTVTSFVEDPNVVDPRHQLDILLHSVYGRSKVGANGAPGARLDALDELYEQVLQAFFGNPSPVLQARLKRVLGTIVLAEERLRPSGLSALLGEDVGSILDVIERLRSVLSFFSEGDTYTEIQIIHLSFADFLIDPKRCKSPRFLVTPSIQHSFLALRCLKLMQESLKYNICQIPSEHDNPLNHEIIDLPAKIAEHVPPALQYASRYWMRHLGLSEVGEELLAALEDFCKGHLHHWLEVLSLLGCVNGAVEALRSTQLFLRSVALRETEATALLYDCERVVQAFYPAISASFIQVYRTAIPFSPTDSPLRRLHQAGTSHAVEVRTGLEKVWSTTLSSRVTGDPLATALAFSPDNTYVVCGAKDGSIQLLNAHTAAQVQAFEGDTDWILCVSFSPTGKEILSGSDAGMVRLWDVATGTCLHVWEGRADSITSVAWSLDGALVASGAQDGSIILRMVAMPEKMVVLRHKNYVRDLAFASDGHLVSGSDDYTCKVWGTKRIDWDATDHTPSHTLEHDHRIMAVAVSPDSCLVACGLLTGATVLWRKSDGQRLRSFPSKSHVISLAFYSDSRLAVACNASPFILWDVSTAMRLDSLDNEDARAAAFSPDGVHVAHTTRDTLQICRWSGIAPWQSNSKKTTASSPAIRAKQWLHSHLPALRASQGMEGKADVLVDDARAVAVSPTGALILAVFDKEWRLWEVSSGQWILTRKHTGSYDTIIAWSPSGHTFACTDTDYAIRVWEVQMGKLVRSFRGHSGLVTAVVFTADEQHLLSASWDGSIRRWKVGQTGQDTSCDVLFQSDGHEITALAVSSDEQWMLSGTSRSDSPPDTSSADLLAKPSRQPWAYHDWGITSRYRALRLNDATGRVVWIEHHRILISSVAFSEDCTRALVGGCDGGVFLYDLTQLIPPDKSAPRSPPPLAVSEYQLSLGSEDILHYAFSPDGQGIIAGMRYVRFPPELQHLSTCTTSVSMTTAHYMDHDGWLWRIGKDSDSRRLCWLLPQHRPAAADGGPTLHSPSTCQHVITYMINGRLMVLDAANC
ncbi:WD40 repeat-like protein [Trametes coccinea BRFM310]|uniref:WD40 repeat-like protein n=1 Tax=Trametes coccinea (strain BRFM310) TaxID=1353009 RepID=A0A1Y2IB54_TRAC3|nr:WD40 repeat-like protein [Trametes coccinea BRFM310]